MIKIRLNFIIFLVLIMFVSVVPAFAAKQQNADNRIKYLNLSWWDKYNDEILSGYLQDVYKNNQDLKIAGLKTKQAQETIKMMFANQLPHIGFDGEYSEIFNSSDMRFGTLKMKSYSQPNYVLPLTMTYELDIWGKNYLATKSVKRQKDIISESERAAYITMTTSFASDYYNLIKTDELIMVQTKIVELQKQIVAMIEKKYNDGMCALPEVLIEKQYLYSVENELDNLAHVREVLINQLKVYLGDRTISKIEHQQYDSIKVFDVPEYLGSEIIQNRPDMVQSEYYIKKTGLDIKVARRELLPKINIFGEIGFNSFYLNRVFAPNTFRSLAGVAPTLDIFSGGAKMAKVRYMKYEYQKAVELYNKTVLTSIQEVNDSLSDAKISKRRFDRDVEKNNIEKLKYNLASEKNSIGALSDFDKLKAEQNLLLVNKDEIISKINYIISTISVYKSVGGKDYTGSVNL
ncbi:MAG: TolC family protein [Candidatus Gastranaerophilales bacterium]|nr:TolC family protein [Candidatus Gastranaerophilales bacterium]